MAEAANLSLFRVPISGGKPNPLVGVGAGATAPHIQGNRLVYVQSQYEATDIWRISGPGSGMKKEPERVIRTNPLFADEQVSVSPGGDKIAFMSTRSGTTEIWIASVDGSDPVRLTYLETYCEHPAWSPNGQSIAFDARDEAQKSIYIVDVDGGKPEELTPGDMPSWSHNGLWIYFSREGQVWKVPVDGGNPIQLTQSGGRRPKESKDERHVYFCRVTREDRYRGGIWRIPVEGGEPAQVLEEKVHPRRWDVSGDRLYFAGSGDGEECSIHFRNLHTGEETEVFRRKMGQPYISDLAVSPDEKWILFVFSDADSSTKDIMLVENFR
jgi:Tol biopolymer transport system component